MRIYGSAFQIEFSTPQDEASIRNLWLSRLDTCLSHPSANRASKSMRGMSCEPNQLKQANSASVLDVLV
jgi:hypothetical protein